MDRLTQHMLRPFFLAAAAFLAISGAPISIHSARADDAIPRAAGEHAPAPTRLLLLRTGTVDTTKTDNLLAADVPFDPALRSVIQLDGPLTPEREAFLAAAGVVLEEYLPDYAYITRTPGATPAALRQLGFVTWAGAFQDAWKIDPQLNARLYTTPDRQAFSQAGVSQVVVVLFQGEDPKPVAAQIAALGGQVLAQSPVGPRWMIDATLPTPTARQLAALPAVQFIEDAPEGTPRNNSNRWILQSNVSNFTPVWNHGITGLGQIAGIIDGSLGEAHCMFDDVSGIPPGPTHRKVLAIRNAGGVDFHGTHVSGTLAGDAPPYNTYTSADGMAFAAKITFSNVNPVYSTPSTLYPRLLDAHNDGAHVHSNSFGDDSTRNYTIWSMQIDQLSWTFEDDMVAFAISNGALATTPENAINVLAVAASDDVPNQNNHCMGGAGPTLDSRRKPEIMAPGCSTTSADGFSSCGTGSQSGTSMACPAIAGGCVLARQYYTDGYYPSGAANPPDAFTPSGALVRATAINSAVDMSGITGYPSNREGWGRMLLDNALSFSSDFRRLMAVDVRNAQGLTTGQTTTHYFYVNSADESLRVTLVFTGPPAAINAADPVINNLDLEVQSPDGLYRGNVFTSNQSQTGGSADARNNVEQFLRQVPAVGWYAVTIRATAVNVPNGPQGYALVTTGDITAGCAAASITDHPDNLAVDAGDQAVFSAAAAGSPTLALRWHKGGNPLSDGGSISGAFTGTLTINPASAADAGPYTLVASNFCGTQTSDPATLSVNSFCPADFNQSGFVSSQDIFDFLAAFFANDLAADFNNSGFVSSQDIFDFLAAFFTPCP